MNKRMLITLDGSELSETLFPYAKEMAGRLGFEMIFLYVCKSHESESLAVYRAYVEHMAEIVASEAVEIREKTGTQMQDQPVKAEGKVAIGHPAEEILRCADEKKMDLLLMATHGRSGIKRWALGSVADKVLRSSTVPVLLVRAAALEKTADDEGQIRKIVVPLDGSEMAESVLPHIEMIAKQRDGELIDVVLLMVCEPLVIPPIATTPITTMEVPTNWGKIVEEHIAYSNKAAREYLAGVEARLNNAGLKVSTEVVDGVPAQEIIDYANSIPCSLIAMVTHGRSGLGRWAYGSVAEKVLSGASRPLLLVRPPSDEGLPLLQTFVGTVRSLPPTI
ncbi:universal stress protein [Chloroflexota bacterium]